MERQLFIFQDQNGSYRLEADASSRSCGESRYEGFTIQKGLSLEEAKRLVDNGVASWRCPVPKCKECGREL